MKSDSERCAENEKFRKIDEAFRIGDLAVLRAVVEDPDSVPNGPMPLAIGPCPEYAICHSPLPFIRTLLEIGADPNPTDHAGFPPLIAALLCSNPQPGAPGRPDVAEIINCCFRSERIRINAVSTTTPPCTWLLVSGTVVQSRSCSKQGLTLGCERGSMITKRRARWQRRPAFGRSRSCCQPGRRDLQSDRGEPRIICEW